MQNQVVEYNLYISDIIWIHDDNVLSKHLQKVFGSDLQTQSYQNAK